MGSGFSVTGSRRPPSIFGVEGGCQHILNVVYYVSEKPVVWMGQSKKDHLEMPDAVQDALGHALSEAQKGRYFHGAVPMRGYLRDVTELRINHEGDTYRMMLTTEIPGVVYVLHVFKKKSKRGLQTPREDIDRITERLKRLRTLKRSGESQP